MRRDCESCSTSCMRKAHACPRARSIRLPGLGKRPRVGKHTELPVLVAHSGDKPWCPARIETPFILERAQPQRDGAAKRQTWLG